MEWRENCPCIDVDEFEEIAIMFGRREPVIAMEVALERVLNRSESNLQVIHADKICASQSGVSIAS